MTEAILFPCLVQGKDAAPDIVRQIKRADEYGVDTIICGRGGGSIEDLWAFNEEIVAEAIYNCKTPIISAVGHEIDWTIADFVADLRAPTPTGAAEMAVPTVSDIKILINNYKIRLNKNIKNMVNTKFIKLRSLKQSFILKNPMAMYEVKEQKLDTLIDKLNTNIKNILTKKENELNKVKLSYVLQNPMNLINGKRNKYEMLLNTLKLVNPLGILEKGYSLVEVDKKIIKSSKEVNVGDTINIKLHEGNIKANVINVVDSSK
jgi:exodeoxyribonuclease VII large subunit